EGGAELAFQDAVDAADLLLFAKLQAVADDFFRPILAVLAGNEIAFFNGALFAVAALALEIKFHALAPALPANRADVSCQVALLTLASLLQVRFTAMAAFFPLKTTAPLLANAPVMVAAPKLPLPCWPTRE